MGSSAELCLNGCGFFGAESTMGFCSKCYRDHQQKQEQEQASLVAAMQKSLSINEDSTQLVTMKKNRCSCCHKRVGLASGFKCRCGSTFCSVHRYPEEHECTFNFKSVGREAIAKANPLLRADKLERI